MGPDGIDWVAVLAALNLALSIVDKVLTMLEQHPSINGNSAPGKVNASR